MSVSLIFEIVTIHENSNTMSMYMYKLFAYVLVANFIMLKVKYFIF